MNSSSVQRNVRNPYTRIQSIVSRVSWDELLAHGKPISSRLRAQDDVPVYGPVSCVHHSTSLVLELSLRWAWYHDIDKKQWEKCKAHANVAKLAFECPPDDFGINPDILLHHILSHKGIAAELTGARIFNFVKVQRWFPRNGPHEVECANKWIEKQAPAIGLLQMSPVVVISDDNKLVKVRDVAQKGTFGHAVTILATSTIKQETGTHFAGYKVYDSSRPIEAPDHDGICYVYAVDLDQIIGLRLV